ncbi:Myosin type-2 heavy chain 1 [Coemansia sp. RSA 2599]|nr:Myosin type-2 heavy chain 1 [Coemansia sp. RSA 2599]
MPFATADADSIARALKILEPYTKGAKAWFEDAEEAWVKGTLVQRADDDTVGIGRLVFVRDDSMASTTAQIIAQTTPSVAVAASSRSSSTENIPGSAPRRRHSVKAAPLEDLLRMVSRGSRLTGGRISSMQRIEDSYIVDIAFAELAEPGADAELLPPLCNPPILDCTPDLTTLSYLHEPAVLYNLKRRYEQQQIYTYSGVVLVAMNPFHTVSLYTPEFMAQYARARHGAGHSGEPHLFAIAENAYRGMVNDQRNQTIIVYGESGSGKTTSAKYIMRYFAQAHHADTNDKQMSTVENQILATNPVFESFGNAKTTRNDNSSRFGKFLDIKFERKQQKIVGGRIRTFLLERSRVAYQPPTERNYHIFYQLLAGASEEQRKAFHLNGAYSSWQAFHYTRQGGEGCGTIAGVDDAEDFALTDASLEMVGIDAERRSDIWRTLAGILYLGNVLISGSESLGSYIDASSEDVFCKAADLLGVKEAKLRQWLTKRQIVTRHDHILAKVNKTQALVIRDSIAKFVYSRLFDWILGPINKSLLPTEVDESLTSFVGVLDIYGFEHFEHNSFEQFCINYANEKLQQNFNHHVFKLEQEEYRREQLENWTFIGFQDNQPCIDLIEGRMGILALLDEESRLEQGSDRTFTEKLYRQFDSLSSSSSNAATANGNVNSGNMAAIASYFRKPRFSNTAFTVKHYAHDVTYEGDGFLEKNKDTVPDEILDLLCSSSFEFVANLAATNSASAAAPAPASVAGPGTSSATTAPVLSAPGGRNASPRPVAAAVAGFSGLASGRSSPVIRSSSPVFGSPSRGRGGIGGGGGAAGSGASGLQRRQAPTLAGVFKRSLSGLMSTLAETEMHYIRCIKPNEAKAAWQFQASMVLSQLRSCGVIETIRISKAGYPSRVPIRTFNERYAVLLTSPPRLVSPTSAGPADEGDVPDEKEHALCKNILDSSLPDDAQYQIGLTKVFLRAGQWAIMEKKRSALFEKAAVTMQRFCRAFLVRRSYLRMVEAAKVIQRRYRRHLQAVRAEALRRKNAVLVIERYWIAFCKYRRFVLQNNCATAIQALIRGVLSRRRFQKMLDMHRLEQATILQQLAEKARKAVEDERLRAEQARRDAETERIRLAAQAARAKAQLADAQKTQIARNVDRDSTTHGLHLTAMLDHDFDNAFDDGLDNEPDEPAAYDEYMAQVPTKLRSDSDVVNEAFARLTVNTQGLQPTSPSVLSSFADLRRTSTQSNEAVRKRSAEARASLIAAGNAGRNAEADFYRQPPSNTSNPSMYSMTAYSPSQTGPSQRNTFGFQEAANLNQQQQQQLKQLQKIPEGGSPAINGHRHHDSLTIGDDIFAIINEFSAVAGGRYGEVDARSLRNKEQQSYSSRPPSRYPANHSPALSVKTPPVPSPDGSKNASFSMFRQSSFGANEHQKLRQQQQQQYPKGFSTYPPGATAASNSRYNAGEPADDSQQMRRSWLIEALRTSHDSSADEDDAESTPRSTLAYGATPSSSKPGYASVPETSMMTGTPFVQSQPNTALQKQQQQHAAAIAAAAGLLLKRDSHGSIGNTSIPSSADVGGRHTAARARAWASRQKDRMLSAFSGNDRNNRRSHSSARSASSKPSAETNRSFEHNHMDGLEPPPKLRFHHQSQSATNVLSHSETPSMPPPPHRFNRPPSAGNLHH